MELHPETPSTTRRAWRENGWELGDPVRRATVLRTTARIESEPTVPGASPHLMAVAAAP
jgi:hypothetical protein